jgi:NADH-quinone oxidoreductase subunit N
MSYLELLQLAAPEAIVTGTVLLVLTIALFAGRKAASATVTTVPRTINESSEKPDATQDLCALVAGLGLLLAAFAIVRLPAHASIFHGMLVVSPLNSLFQIIVLSLAFFTVLLARAERSLGNQGEYLAIILLAAIGLILLVGSEELLTIFIGLELTGLSLYILTGFEKSRQVSAEAALKYFLFGSTASAFTLFGLSFIYGLTGTTTLEEIAPNLADVPVQPILLAGVVLTLIGFAFKIAAAPFHLWAPDAYQGGPISSAAFIASGSKVASFVVLGKILLIGFVPLHGNAAWHAIAGGWMPILAALAALSILIGNLAALVQKNVRRLLAYSAVAHTGYTLLGLIAGGRAGFSATLFYTTLYGITLVGAFGIVGFVRRETGGEELSDFAGLRARSPLLAACLAIFVLSLAGLPPLAGFFGKFYLFTVALGSAENYGLLWLVVIALLGSLISLYYYLLILKAAFVDDANSTGFALRSDRVTHFGIAILAFAVVLFGILPSSLLSRIFASL